MAEDRRAAQVRAFITHLPFCKALGLALVEIRPGSATLALPWSEALIGDPATGVIHGGAVSALMDTTCGAAVMSHPEAGQATATLDLRIDYMRAAAPGQTVTARADVTQLTRSLAFVRATAWDDDAERPVATAAGAFTVLGGRDGTGEAATGGAA